MSLLIEPQIPLNEQMRCGVFTNAKGDVLIVHDQKISGELEWVEYNKTESTISLIQDDGGIIDLGIAVDDKMKKNLAHGLMVSLAFIQDKEIVSSQKITMVIQDY